MEIAPTAPDRFTACRGSFMPARPPEMPTGAAAGRRGIGIPPAQRKPPSGAQRAHSGQDGRRVVQASPGQP